MASARVVPALDVSEHGKPCLGLGLEAAAIDQFAFEAGEEALGHGIVVGITDTAHRGTHAHGLAAAAELDGGVLGGFKRSSQHLRLKELQWDHRYTVVVAAGYVQQ